MTHVPIATYRIQFTPEFGFKEAAGIVEYLNALGITDIYASPIFHARKGSTHGYDVVDPCSLNPELGSEEDFNNLADEVKNHGMGWLQDIVPNHMAIGSDNHMLMDIFECGTNSKYYDFFEIDWDPPQESMKGKMLVPLLGKLYAECLEAGELKLKYSREGLSINYYQLRLPILIKTYPTVFRHNLAHLEQELGENNPEYIKLLGTLNLIESINSEKGGNSFYQQIALIKKMLWSLHQENNSIRRFIDGNLAFFNSENGDRDGVDNLDRLISQQIFRLSYWKVATEEINYRRFFTVNDLISVNIRDNRVFEYTHQLIFKNLSEGKFTGLRVDHIDGLFDPENYLIKLREKIGDTFVVVEKILQADEHIPQSWPIQGTTGYDFLNDANRLFCDDSNRSAFSKLYYKYVKLSQGYEELLYNRKKLIIEKHMAGNIDNLAQYIRRISSHDRYGQDITTFGLKRALEEVIAFFPVYRTYINNTTITEEDRGVIGQAINAARDRNPDLAYELKFLEKFLLLEYGNSATQDEKQVWLNVAMNFQQYTGPIMAKGFEDTVLYIYNRLVSLNEVGGDPNNFGIAPDRFHQFNLGRAENFPYSLNAGSTHDTKRGEDTRARINVLSEIPAEWEYSLKRWSRINRGKKKKAHGQFAPDRNDEYFLYQTMVGTYTDSEEPEFYKQRIKDYCIKAVREAKMHTAWIKPDNDYEEAFLSFIDKVFDRSKNGQFWEEFLPFQKKITNYGTYNSLSQVLLKMTCPGVPDFYQGSEFWDLSLVDPDNRRPVDFEKRARSLDDIKQAVDNNIEDLIKKLMAEKDNGRIKQFLIYRVLSARKDHMELFLNGKYMPLEVRGRFTRNVIAFARNLENSCAVAAVPRFLTNLADEDESPLGEKIWQDTKMIFPEHFPQNWINAITGEKIAVRESVIPVGDIFSLFPAALLISEEE
jgi:(1->4)-alpha-D-glucan 1-alpha-D-glucosylmutase